MAEPTLAPTSVFPNGIDVDQLRQQHYNATISSIRVQHPDLWVMHVVPDEPHPSFEAGQYTTLGLGYWEPRVDEVSEDFENYPTLIHKVARRSYSVSSSIIDENGGLLPPYTEALEFYIVLVHPEGGHIPALTPRIFALEPRDRIYLGRKFTGRYTLAGVEPTDDVVFLATGTGEAPQNQMTAKLLRDRHQGSITQVVCVRHRIDLAYLDQQRAIEERFPTYRYLALTTREPTDARNKVYIQDLLESGDLESTLGRSLVPGTTHFFLCGNPQMIGLPDWHEDGTLEFPEVRGVCEILTERGFTLDHRRDRGDVHYEEYWK